MLTIIRALKNHTGFIRYLRNTSWMMGEQFLRIISGLFVGVWVARYLGPEQFGLFSYVLAFTAIFGSIAKLGLDSIIIRELVWGTGSAMREFLYVDDMAAASIFVLVLDEKTYQSNTKPMLSHINVGRGKDITIREMAEIMKQVVG